MNGDKKKCPQKKQGMHEGKKGFYFTVDALLAALLLIAGLILITKFFVVETQNEQMTSITHDLMNSLNEIHLKDIEDPFIEQEIANGNMTDLNVTVMYKIAEYWTLNKSDKAITLTRLYVDDLIPERYGVNISFGDQLIYSRQRAPYDEEPKSIVRGSRMISGIAPGKAIRGSSSAAYLKRIRDKRTSTYLYFGGFEGQGNITKHTDDIPVDVTSNDITEIKIEVDTPSPFNLYINGDVCDTFTPVMDEMEADIFNATHCNSSLQTGDNEFLFEFNNELNNSYIAGGYIKISYKTDQFQHNTTPGIFRYHFPGIDGIMNIYSSFYVPGEINSYKANVTFFNNYSTFLTIGNETVFNVSGSDDMQSVYRERGDLDWPTSTIPIRLGVKDVDFYHNVTGGEPADVVLVNDVSGSMGWCGLYTSPLYQCRYRCISWTGWYWVQCRVDFTDECNSWDNPCGGWLCNNHNVLCDNTRIDLLKRAANTSVNTFLNYSGTRVGLVSYESNTRNTLPVTDDAGTLHTRINSYYANGGTCICCGINSARGLLPGTNQEHMIVISDGDATHDCGGDPFDDAIDAGQAACADGISVYTIGFGPDISEQGTNTLKQIACNTSMYYNASDVEDLDSILQNISEEIIIISNYSSQTITVSGNITRTNLSRESYIEINYTPEGDEARPNEITITFETEKFNTCTPEFSLPQGVRMLQSKVTSYSGPHWTDNIKVNDDEIFNLSMFSTKYGEVGDPFIVEVPVNSMHTGEMNRMELRTGDKPENYTNCSDDNSLIYIAGLNSSTSRTNVVEKAEGCVWYVEFEDGTYINSSIPEEYVGENACNYTNTSIAYNTTDAYDISVFNILSDLDFDEDGRVFVNLHAEDLEVVVTLISQVPYLWGPNFMEIVLWQ